MITLDDLRAAVGRTTGVRWGGWAGSSTAGGQQRFTTAWNLSRVVDLWDNAFTWTYRQVSSTVGSGTVEYTQATYVDTVDGPGGDTAVFTYGDKAAAGYELPYSTPGPPNAWQFSVEKEYLASIDFRTPSGSRQLVRFDYSDASGNSSFLGSGTLTKRLLMGIALEHTDGSGQPVPDAIPPTRFTYVTSSGAAGYGSIASATTAGGGASTYAYTAPTALPLCTRDFEIDAPAISGGVTCASPRFWFADDYVVVLWQRSDAKAEVPRSPAPSPPGTRPPSPRTPEIEMQSPRQDPVAKAEAELLIDRGGMRQRAPRAFEDGL